MAKRQLSLGGRPSPSHVSREFCPVAHPGFFVDVLQMRFDGGDGNAQRVGGFLRGAALQDERDDFGFAGGKRTVRGDGFLGDGADDADDAREHQRGAHAGSDDRNRVDADVREHCRTVQDDGKKHGDEQMRALLLPPSEQQPQRNIPQAQRRVQLQGGQQLIHINERVGREKQRVLREKKHEKRDGARQGGKQF